MKRKILGIIAFMVVTFATFNVVLNNDKSEKFSNLTLVNIAHANDIETGAGITSQAECQSQYGYWGMALVLASEGVNSVQCEVEGEITFFGMTIFGSFTKGKPYNIAWTFWACNTASGCCCIGSSQGIRFQFGV
jgi:hypothetical protein